MRLLDLFPGIGGFSLGLERAGMRTVAFCEIDKYCQRVLKKHWPTIPVFGDIRELTVHEGWLVSNADQRRDVAEKELCAGRQRIRADSVDAICGGFPCQDISVAGKGAGIGGERSGLWSEYARIIGEVRPRYAIIENVTALLGRGIERVLWDLWQIGYDAEWMCIRASDIGALHQRDRVWIVAYPNGSNGYGRRGALQMGWGGIARQIANDGEFGRAQWCIEPAVRELVNGVSNRLVRYDGRVANGVPNRVNKLRALGNAVVPQIPELIGRAIMQETLVNRA